MNLTAEQVRNLNILADFMEGLDDPTFNMLMYRHDCRTPACAFGWACTVPALQAKGLSFALTDDSITNQRIPVMGRVFGGDSFRVLFSNTLHSRIKTPQQWAAHCRAFLKSNGYATADHF